VLEVRAHLIEGRALSLERGYLLVDDESFLIQGRACLIKHQAFVAACRSLLIQCRQNAYLRRCFHFMRVT